MKKALPLISLGLLLLVTGCIPSVHPLYTNQDLVFDPRLVGEWVQKEGPETWTFTKNGTNAYTLLYVDEKGKRGEFVVHLLKVGDRRFLDLYPADPNLPHNDLYKCHLQPVHTFLRVELRENVLQRAFLNPDWIKKQLLVEPEALKHEMVEDRVILTAQPKQLQAFLLKHDQTAQAWDEAKPLNRRIEATGKREDGGRKTED